MACDSQGCRTVPRALQVPGVEADDVIGTMAFRAVQVARTALCMHGACLLPVQTAAVCLQLGPAGAQGRLMPAV